MLNTSKVLPKPTHRVEHILVTEGRPVKAKYWRLDNARQEAAKKEFAELEKQEVQQQLGISSPHGKEVRQLVAPLWGL